MGFYLYCVGPPELSPPDVPGLEDAPLLLVRADALEACVSALGDRPAPTVERVRRHHRVVRAATSERLTPLPARFGQWFPSREALAARLLEGGDGYRRALENVRGALELGVRLRASSPSLARTPSPTTAPAIGSVVSAVTGEGAGRAYMMALARRRDAERERRERAVRTLEPLRSRLRPLARAERLEEPSRRAVDEETVAAVAHLVPRRQISRYREEVLRFAAARPELRVELDGPSPPYSFAG